MTEAEIRAAALTALRRVAPEADPAALRPGERLRDQLDLDSMDFLTFLIGLHEALGVEIPESDYGKLRTLDAIVAYLRARIPGTPAA